MELELWSNSEDEFGLIIDDSIVRQRVYLENHMFLEGVDVSEIATLNALYNKELIKKKNTLDNIEFLMNLSRNWFSLTSYFNRYIEFSDGIVFNHSNNRFESLVNTYLSIAERYIDSYDEDGNSIVFGEFEFTRRKKLNIEDGLEIKSEAFKEEYLYKINESDNYLYTKIDLTLGVRRGIIISKPVANYLLWTTY
jgi:hypothetical protein